MAKRIWAQDSRQEAQDRADAFMEAVKVLLTDDAPLMPKSHRRSAIGELRHIGELFRWESPARAYMMWRHQHSELMRIVSAAEHVIKDLRTHPAQVEYLKAPHADFVYVEEGLSRLLVDLPEAAYMVAFGIVMQDLAKDGIKPPTWFVKGTPNG